METDASGNEVKPLDISITKNVTGLFVNSGILVSLVLSCARWDKKHRVEKVAPKGMVGMVEACILGINDDVIKGFIGKDYKRYAPYLLTAFFFILDVYKRQDYMLRTAAKNVTRDVSLVFDFIERPYSPVRFKELLVSPNERCV